MSAENGITLINFDYLTQRVNAFVNFTGTFKVIYTIK